MESLGEYLRQGRKDAGLSLDDLAGKTRIRIENLRSLETGDFESLPSETYVRGFVKLVCRELGLPPEEGLARYDALRRGSAPPDVVTWAEEPGKPEPGRLERALEDPERVVAVARRAGRGLAWAAGAVVVVLLVLAVVRFVGKPGGGSDELAAARPGPDRPSPSAPGPARPTGGPTASDADDDAGGDAGGATASAPAGGSPPGGDAEPSAAELELEPEPVKTAPPPPPRETPKANPEPPPSETRPAETRPAATQTPTAPPAVPAVPAARTADRVELRLEASRAVSVAVLLDGIGVPRTRDLAAGESATWKADRRFVISASDAGAVRVFLDGRARGPLGPDGESRENVAIAPGSAP